MLAARRLLLFTVISVLLLSVTAYGADALKTIRFMAASPGEGVIVYEIAKRLGFYHQEGLAVEVIVARMSTSIQAIVGGSADYLNHRSAFPMILKGVPFKVLLASSEKSPHYLVVSPKIGSSFKDLVGKTIAIDDFAGNAAQAVREVLGKKGIALDQVQLRVMGPPHLRFQALLSGAVDAAPLVYVHRRQAQQRGFRLLASAGDFISEMRFGVIAPQKKLQLSASEVHRFVKATLKARLFLLENPAESLKFYMEVMKLTDVDLAKDSWNELLDRSTKVASPEAMADYTSQAMDQQKGLESAGQITKPSKAEEIFDFSFAKRAHEELAAADWDAKRYRYVEKRN
jgi:ABC-type nitrate/sulfonate/bicarbonate transport system substrate-binding protein